METFQVGGTVSAEIMSQAGSVPAGVGSIMRASRAGTPRRHTVEAQ